MERMRVADALLVVGYVFPSALVAVVFPGVVIVSRLVTYLLIAACIVSLPRAGLAYVASPASRKQPVDRQVTDPADLAYFGLDHGPKP